jgi:hypothetical protein
MAAHRIDRLAEGFLDGMKGMSNTALRGAIGAVVAAAMAVSLIAASTASAGVGMKCPGTFKVQNNDRIGKLKLPAGNYVIKVKRMSCQDASSNFTKFLDRPDGDLPNGWTLNAKKAKFKNKRMNVAFTVKSASSGGGGGGGGGGGNATSGKCPGTFMVQNDDKIGKLKLPKGNYLIRVKNMSCSRASSLFTKFLDRPDGDLPNGWSINLDKQQFVNDKRGVSFRVKRVS